MVEKRPYSELTKKQIKSLEMQGCVADDWSRVGRYSHWTFRGFGVPFQADTDRASGREVVLDGG